MWVEQPGPKTSAHRSRRRPDLHYLESADVTVPITSKTDHSALYGNDMDVRKPRLGPNPNDLRGDDVTIEVPLSSNEDNLRHRGTRTHPEDYDTYDRAKTGAHPSGRRLRGHRGQHHREDHNEGHEELEERYENRKRVRRNKKEQDDQRPEQRHDKHDGPQQSHHQRVYHRRKRKGHARGGSDDQLKPARRWKDTPELKDAGLADEHLGHMHRRRRYHYRKGLTHKSPRDKQRTSKKGTEKEHRARRRPSERNMDKRHVRKDDGKAEPRFVHWTPRRRSPSERELDKRWELKAHRENEPYMEPRSDQYGQDEPNYPPKPKYRNIHVKKVDTEWELQPIQQREYE